MIVSVCKSDWEWFKNMKDEGRTRTIEISTYRQLNDEEAEIQLEINEDNSFEEQFPSIKQLDSHVESGDLQIIKSTGEIFPVTKHFFVPGEVIMRFCLDKQRVKDAIKKCSSTECLIKELGL